MSRSDDELRGGSRWCPRPLHGGVACLALVATLACAPADEAAEPEEAAPGASAPGAPGALDPEAWLGELSIGRAVDPRGAIREESAAGDFTPGETVYLSIEVGETPPEAGVHAIFYDPDGAKVAEDAKKVPADARYLYFDSGDTAHWAPGGYRVEVLVDGERVGERSFALAPSG